MERFKEFPPFNKLSDNELQLLNNSFSLKNLKKDEFILRDKETTSNIYFILSGKVSMYKTTSQGKERVIYLLGKGEFLNEVVFDGLSSSINGKAFENTTIGIFKVDSFKKVMESNFTFTMEVMRSLGRKVRRLYRQLKNTLPTNLTLKVGAKLWKLSKDYKGRVDGPWVEIRLELTTVYLASMLGHTRESISRELKNLQEKNLLRKEGKHYFVNQEELSSYFKGIE